MRLTEWLEGYRRERYPDDDDIPPALCEELELRLKEMDEHPELLQPFEESDVERLFQEFANARQFQTSSRKR